MWWGDGPDGWEWIWMGAMMAMMWLPLVLLALWALRQFGASSPPSGTNRRGPDADSESIEPREVARRAYARGEMNREQFLRVIEDLDRTEARPAPRPEGGHR